MVSGHLIMIDIMAKTRSCIKDRILADCKNPQSRAGAHRIRYGHTANTLTMRSECSQPLPNR